MGCRLKAEEGGIGLSCPTSTREAHGHRGDVRRPLTDWTGASHLLAVRGAPQAEAQAKASWWRRRTTLKLEGADE
jgi:hypothetical protein